MPTTKNTTKIRAIPLLVLLAVIALTRVLVNVHASPALAKPTHLISIGAHSFRCQCDPTAVDLNFSGECLPSDFTQVTSACSTLAENCVCTEILHLVRRGCETFERTEQSGQAAESAALNKVVSEFDKTLGRKPIKNVPSSVDTSVSTGSTRADPGSDKLFNQMRQDLKALNLDPAAKAESVTKAVKAVSSTMTKTIEVGCKAVGQCKYLGVPEKGAVEIVQRGPNGDFDVQLKTTADEGVTAADNGLVEAELREVFGGKDSGFVLEEKLGQGSFGVVFKASSSDGIEMAIKFVRTDDPVAVAKDLAINNEMLRVFGDTPYEPLFSLPQGVLKIKRTGREDQLALIFDKMDMDLITYLNDGLPPDFDFMRTIGNTMFHGLRVMEKAGLVHADIKLDNILYTPAKNGRASEARLADFGLTRHADDFARDRNIAGTMTYASPEMLFDRVQTSKSDVWAVGVTLYSAAVGVHPFGKLPDTKFDFVRGFGRLLGKEGVPPALAPFVPITPTGTKSLIKVLLEAEVKQNENIPMSQNKRAELADLLEQIFVADPAKRISAEDAVRHPFFRPSTA